MEIGSHDKYKHVAMINISLTYFLKYGHDQWIGLKENSEESSIFHAKIYGFRFTCSLTPIHWHEEVVPNVWVKN